MTWAWYILIPWLSIKFAVMADGQRAGISFNISLQFYIYVPPVFYSKRLLFTTLNLSILKKIAIMFYTEF